MELEVLLEQALKKKKGMPEMEAEAEELKGGSLKEALKKALKNGGEEDEDGIEIPKDEFADEHVSLISKLEDQDEDELEEEKEDQAKELGKKVDVKSILKSIMKKEG